MPVELRTATLEDASRIEQLYVDPEFCGQGIGTELMGFALSALRRPILVYTFEPNTRARSFYEAHGFRPVEFSDGSQNEERCPDVLYRLDDRCNAAWPASS